MFLIPAIPCLIFPCAHGPNSSAFPHSPCLLSFRSHPTQLSQWREVVSTQRCGVTEIETPKLSTHVYVFICSSVPEIKGTKKTDGGRGMEEMDNQKRQGMLRQKISTCLGPFWRKMQPWNWPMEGKNPAIDTCDRDMTKVKKTTWVNCRV